MTEMWALPRNRRGVLKNGAVLAGTLAIPGALSAKHRITAKSLAPEAPPVALLPTPMVEPITSAKVVRPELLRRALAALDRHSGQITHRDRIALVDFTAPSSQPRMHFIDLTTGKSTSMLVAHGSGSDPEHTGWLKRFSNDDGSNASCEGAFLAADYYVGKHGQSQRLIGLDATNCNALSRAIVVHSAWYSNPDMLKTHGMLGRSQGCFAVGQQDLNKAFAQLGPGRMIYSTKI